MKIIKITWHPWREIFWPTLIAVLTVALISLMFSAFGGG